VNNQPDIEKLNRSRIIYRDLCVFFRRSTFEKSRTMKPSLFTDFSLQENRQD
jgi:hypothetical protein